MDLPGGFMEYPSKEPSLNTPIKRIQNLTLNSPSSPLYPSLDDIIITSPSQTVVTSMLERGYSQKITNNVLQELNSRANEISNLITSPPSNSNMSSRTATSRRSKRYSGIHHHKFQQMESISHHYSVHEMPTEKSPVKTVLNSNLNNNLNSNFNSHGTTMDPGSKRSSPTVAQSSTKRRRTLNGPEEVLNSQQGSLQLSSSPDKTLSSPIRKISPSKKSMNLHSILTGNEDSVDNSALSSPTKEKEFAKPYPPSSKFRASSLQMAGVHTPQLQKKSSIPQLQKKSSIPNLQKKPSSSNLQTKPLLSNLQKKPSIPNLQSRPSIPNLQQKSSISNLQAHASLQQHPSYTPSYAQPTLSKKTSIPQLQKKSSIPNLSYSKATTFSSSSNSTSSSKLPSSSSSRSISPSSSTRSLNSRILGSSSKINTDPVSSHKLPVSSSARSISHSNHAVSSNAKVTVPQPFSLYDKPTISSSQKSLNKFQRFRDKFN
ncbi:uncharacterized protein RJT20DRAFT_132005 [Scheffersomyces xylosifermentans]|uniref:uncharacterized protein n=1 Tax=Scheffersomyces xylosifermentans TaxID=1304137 RepID=UPI00315DA836